tara:strand:+ start:7763 stop:7930 length:168 start_codon:yes stop_codon:yes gene_type:complete
VKEWLQPMAEKSWQAGERKVGKKFPYPQSHVTRNDNKKPLFEGVILLRMTPFFLY